MKMKLTEKMITLLLVFFLVLGMSGCGNVNDNSNTDGTGSNPKADGEQTEEAFEAVTITDMIGREITLDGPAERIVALTPSDCEILYAIGAGDTLAGRGTYCDYPVEVLEIPAVESGATINLEEIIALKPDVLLMSDMAQIEEQIVQLEAAGITVVVSNADNLEDVYTSIEMIGKVMDREENAAEVIDSMKTTFERIRESSSGDGTQTIYFEVSPLQYGLWAAGSNTFMDEIAAMLGLTNCFADVEDWGEISEEQVLKRNPDFIVTVAMDFGEGLTPEEEILSREGWETITAVQNKAILNLQNNELSRPAPRLAEGAQLLFDFVYGEDADEE